MDRKVIAVDPDMYDSSKTAFALSGMDDGEKLFFGQGEVLLDEVLREINQSCGVLVIAMGGNLALFLACGWVDMARAPLTLAAEENEEGHVAVGLSNVRGDTTQNKLLFELVTLGRKSDWVRGDPVCVVRSMR